MNSEIEKGLEAWLEAVGVEVPLFTGLTFEQVPTDSQVISIFCEGTERIVGPLYRARVSLTLATPPFVNTDDNAALALAEHRSIEGTIARLLEALDTGGAEAAVLKATFNGATSLFSRGTFYEGADESVDENRWITTFKLVAGIATSNA